MAAGEEGRSGAAERAGGGGGRQSQFKPKHNREAEAARRHAALNAQQSQARASRIDDMRRISMEALLCSHDNDVEAEVEVEDEDDDAAEEKMVDAEADADADMVGKRRHNGNKMKRLRRLNRTMFFARQMQAPDWMIDVPSDLSTAWMMMVRPEGDRCLLFSHDGGRVEIRRKNGYVHERYTDARMPKGLTILDVVCVESPQDPLSAIVETSSKVEAAEMEPDVEEIDGALPLEEDGLADEASPDAADVDMGSGSSRGAGHRSRGRGRGYTSGGRGGKGKGRSKGKEGSRQRANIDRKYAVCDVLFWDGTDMVGADTECRMFWLASRFAELPEKTPRKARPLVLIPAVDVTPEAVAEAYEADVGYSKDSLQFMHRQAHYAIDAPCTPLSLMWRDRHISRFVVDTPDHTGEKLPERQAVVLELRGSGYLRTAERAVVAQLQPDELEGILQDKTRAKMLVRCEVESVDVTTRTLKGVKPLAVVPARSRVWPDSWSRILFQHLHRKGDTGGISFNVVARAAMGVAPPAG